MAAFDLAVRAGVDVLEMDVHLSRDGVVVVHHDPTLERTTNGRGFLANQDYVDLERLDAGFHFRSSSGDASFRGGSCKIPRLSEVLEAFPELGFNIEVKQRRPSMIAAVLKELERAGARNVLLAAADADIMQELEAARPGVPLGLSAAQCWTVWWRGMLGRVPRQFKGRALQIPPRYGGVLPVASRRVIRAAHAAGIEVHLWTINDSLEASHWLSRGVDGLMSDDPAAIAAPVRAARRESA